MDLGHRQRKIKLHTEDRRNEWGIERWNMGLSDRGQLRSKNGEGGLLLLQRQPTQITSVAGSQLLQAC